MDCQRSNLYQNKSALIVIHHAAVLYPNLEHCKWLMRCQLAIPPLYCTHLPSLSTINKAQDFQIFASALPSLPIIFHSCNSSCDRQSTFNKSCKLKGQLHIGLQLKLGYSHYAEHASSPPHLYLPPRVVQQLHPPPHYPQPLPPQQQGTAGVVPPKAGLLLLLLLTCRPSQPQTIQPGAAGTSRPLQ